MEPGRCDRRFATHYTGCSTGHTVFDINCCVLGSIDGSWYTHILSTALGRWRSHLDNSVINDDYFVH
jgi:hypothetical protein